jgi:hypothetical protein
MRDLDKKCRGQDSSEIFQILLKLSNRDNPKQRCFYSNSEGLLTNAYLQAVFQEKAAKDQP